MNDTTQPAGALTERPEKIRLAPVVDTSEFSSLLDSDRFAQIQRVANLFSESDLVPAVFQGKPANCAVALQMAFRMRVDPMMLMQNMYIIKGRPGIEAKLAIALMNARGPFTGPLQWKEEGEGDSRSWTCYAVHRETNQQCSATVTWKMVRAEGWADKDGSKWKSIPEIMGRYRSAMFLGRLYCPEVLLGLPTEDELQDAPRYVVGERVVEPEPEIELPRAKATKETIVNAALDAGAPQVDVVTGEITRPVESFSFAPSGAAPPTPGNTAADVAAGRVAEPVGPAGVSAQLELGADAGKAAVDQKIADDPMALKRIASKAQRNMIEAIASKHCGLTPEQLDQILVEKFAVTLATLPMVMVNETLQFIRTVKA